MKIETHPQLKEPLNYSSDHVTLMPLIREGASMTDQLSFASLDFVEKKKRTKQDVFLSEMATVVPWA